MWILTGTVRSVERKELKYSTINLSVDCLLRSISVECVVREGGGGMLDRRERIY